LSPAFELREVSVRYDGQPALRDVSLRIGRGEKVALVGRSGAGKSTLLRVLFEHAREDVAMIPQDLGLVRSLSVFHNVYMARLPRHGSLYNLANLLWPLPAEVAEIRPLLERLDLLDKIFEPTGQLSGGQQQRTAVARALHQQAAVMMADEPVSSVDEHQSRRVLRAITAAHDCVVMAMHDTALAIEFASRIVGLEQGRVVLDRSSEDITPADLKGLYGA
jgi:phosphonate transport system ATP-binding protein